MSSAAETGFISIFIPLLIVCIFSVRPVIFDMGNCCHAFQVHFLRYGWVNISDQIHEFIDKPSVKL